MGYIGTRAAMRDSAGLMSLFFMVVWLFFAFVLAVMAVMAVAALFALWMLFGVVRNIWRRCRPATHHYRATWSDQTRWLGRWIFEIFGPDRSKAASENR